MFWDYWIRSTVFAINAETSLQNSRLSTIKEINGDGEQIPAAARTHMGAGTRLRGRRRRPMKALRGDG